MRTDRLASRAALVACLACAPACSGGSGDATTRTRDAAPADGSVVDATVVDAADATEPPIDAFVEPPDAFVDPPDAGRGAPYPIVLSHGFFGFEDFAGVDFATYFFGVKDDLAAHGETSVFTPAVDPFASSTARGEELVERVREILATTGAARVNLIGHSQGGLDVRYVASTHPELVASVTTIATPHRGTPIADIVLGLVRDDRSRELVNALVILIASPLYDEAGNETRVVDALRQLSTDGAADFNERYPDAPGIPYWSLTGRTALSLGGPECDAPDAPPFVREWARTGDTLEPLLAIPHAIVAGGLVDPVVNDGLVPVTSARWGTFLGCLPADHLDEVGHLFGDRPGITNDLDHRAFFRALVGYLRAEGL